METQQISTTLKGLIGHLKIESAEDQKKLNQLKTSLSKSVIEKDQSIPRQKEFSIEKSDLFSDDTISDIQKKSISAIIKTRTKTKNEASYKVFRREVPVREQLLYNSVADWAAGSRVDHSIGPLTGPDGRQLWYDFYPIEKLVTLYMKGVAEPVLLFKIKQNPRLTARPNIPIRVSLTRTYSLVKGSIWINTKFLAPNAPAGTYAGLTISGGTITLSKAPQTINNKLTIASSTNVNVLLNLDQPQDTDADAASPYGKDARNAQLQLPETLQFHFSGNGRIIDKVGNASWSLYGQKMKFEWIANQQTVYDTNMQRIFFPFKPSGQNITIKQNQSDFHFLDLNKKAAIQKSGWVLPVAAIDTSQPTAASGIGEMFVRCKQGLFNKWAGLKGGSFALNAPGFLVGPGQILVADLAVGNPHASQLLKLWKENSSQTGTSVNLSFSDSAPFFYVSNGNGNELLMTYSNADFRIDRPVKVNGEPPLVRSLDSLLIIAAGTSNKLVYLYDNNLILDDAQINNQDPVVPEEMALALTNALFKVTQPNGCLLFGNMNKDYDKVEKGFLFLTFGLLAYIPTLPDPYAANLGVLQRQIRGTSKGITGGVSGNQQINAWLVCRTAWSVSSDENKMDDVFVSFHFASLNNQFGDISLNPPKTEEPSNPEPESPVTPVGNTNITAVKVSGIISKTDTPVSRLSGLNLSNTLSGTRKLTSTFKNVTTDRGLTETDATTSESAAALPKRLPDYEEEWDKDTFRYRRDLFALLDVSTNADLFGISFDLLMRRDFRVTTGTNATGEAVSSFFPVQVEGMDVVSAGANVKAFTVPQISWEPVFNLSPPAPPPDGPVPGDPAGGFNYYPNDGGPTRILNNSADKVPLAPLPVTSFLVDKRDTESDFKAFSFFTLPFGMKSVALLSEKYVYNNVPRDGGDLNKLKVSFDNEIHSGLQLKMDAGIPLREGDSKMFMGTTVQINNILDFAGNETGNSTLGGSVTSIFNREFFYDTNYPFELFKQRGVPVTRMDLSGYGASMFSNWLNTKAAIAETSQAKFDVFVGRCSHEIIQVKSILYPWAIKVVRTITLFRVNSGYVYRFDSGWRAESDGKFDFRYFTYENNPNFPGGTPENPEPQLISKEQFAEFEIHPGLVKALYNVSNIIETNEVEPFNENVTFDKSVDQLGVEINTPKNYDIELQPVYFDADVEVEGVLSGMVTKPTSDGDKKIVPSKRILGFVQLGPKGFPLNNTALRLLITRQGTIGGSIDCEVNLVDSTQKMRLSRFDFNNSFAGNGTDPTFCVAGRGNVLLPKEGSWSMVKHERANGDVSPVPENLSIPVIREGKIVKNGNTVKIDPATPVTKVLTRIAEPAELLRQPVSNTINYGLLQSTDTQKALFLTPSFKKNTKKLLSKTPPLFVDAFRIVNTKGIFPNIGEAENFAGDVLGEAILMKKGGNFPFNISNLQDLGKDVFELMDIQDTINNVKQQGLQLLHNPEDAFDLPTEFELIDVGDGNFRIYIEYDKKDKNGNVEQSGELDFDINSVAESWKGKMNNIGLVIDLAGIKRLMTIRGNWDSENGKEATYPKPDLEFAPELDPLVDLLEILQSLQEGDCGEAVQNGLKLAMSNKAGSWEYKFEASKEIPVIRFPVPDAVYNDPNTPFKLEAGLKIGAYFNAALKVTTDANELLPSAGGVLGFYARLSVMCVSVSAATVYAIGQANVDIAADTKIGPSLRMKFGFGAQIVVGLPVAGNVSILFVVGAEIFIASGIVQVSAFMLFEGHAEILGGIVSITIRIEAKGTYSKKALGGGASRTDLQCQVTFGLDISIAFIINISFTESWQEQRQIA
ncbi:hypothetical protein [Maribellus maritimus]|uniref:hypothetical protein n=1 Tax=Maribellus maritimus TaxID=2870838 RepID=UPI001EEA3FE9|nr:hypothetical protein [Maribellus maritimus]MCG6190383.1 hypothetical protein [Maribellus maritimus]